MSSTLSVGAVQFDLAPVVEFGDFAGRVRAGLDAVRDTRVAVFGECMTIGLAACGRGWGSKPPAEAFAEVSKHTSAYEELFLSEAQRRDQVIFGGSHFVATDEGLMNVAHVFFPDGSVVRHVKSHLFPSEFGWLAGEGDKLTVVDVDDVRLGLMICYEAEVPEVATILARQGADILIVPSFTFTEAGFNRVRITTAARCIENQTYAVHCSTYGEGAPPIPPAWAKSSILGPCDRGLPADGVLAEASVNEVGTIRYELDLHLLRDLRKVGDATTVYDRERKKGLYQAYRATP